ncbi:DNA double-strand break repair nuclease NurA [Haloferacaceae archaeon DSL9]
MTLDPIHVDTIARLASTIADGTDDSDHEDLARTVWDEWLTPLTVGDRRIIEPVDEHALRAVPTDDIALAERPFDCVHGLDSGTINPTTFKNGLVLDVAHAAMASEPSELDLHRSRTIVATVHSADETVNHDTDWISEDEGYTRRRVMHVPRVNRYAEGVVHALALYLAESEHALVHLNTVAELLVLDGPLYPKELLSWQDRNAELSDLAREMKPRSVLENYIRLVERSVERDVPLVGFVKNPATSVIVRALGDKRGIYAPWSTDTTFFTRLLERREADDVGEADPGDDRLTDRLTFTSWLVSRGGADRTLAEHGDALGIERSLSPEQYEVTFFALYDPRRDLLYRIEAPYAFTSDPELRRRLTTQLLSEVAATRGPPEPVAKADELARINASEKAAIRRKFERSFHSEHARTYNDYRWTDSEAR